MTTEVFGITQEELSRLILRKLPFGMRSQEQIDTADALARQMLAGPMLYDACVLVYGNRETLNLSEAQRDWLSAAIKKAEGK